MHAAGVVIAPGPLDEFVPICTQASKGAGAGDEERVIVTQYDMNCLEQAGMLKMDFLGLTTLTVITDTVKLVKETRGEDVVLETRGFTDPDTYRVLRAGRTGGVFQFESPLATDVLKRMRCDRFDDLVASNALLRPGPLDAGMHNVYIRRKRGEEPVSYALPELEAILSTTYGVITYQEQVMRIAQVLAGISLAEADVLRKAVGKKDAALIEKELGKFEDEGRRPRARPGDHRGAGRTRSRRSAATASTSRTRWPTRCSRTTRRGSRRTTPPSSWRRCCRRRSARPKRSSSTSPRPARWGSRCCRPT